MTVWTESFGAGAGNPPSDQTWVGDILCNASGKGYSGTAANQVCTVAVASFADGYVQAETCCTNNMLNPAGRITDVDNCYRVRPTSSGADAYSRVSGTDTLILNDVGAFSAGALVKLTMNGTTITVDYEGSSDSVVSTTHTTGLAGYWGTTSNLAHTTDNWEASDDLGGGGGANPLAGKLSLLGVGLLLPVRMAVSWFKGRRSRDRDCGCGPVPA